MDAISISALIISVIGALGHFVETSHLQKCDCFCVNSDCRQKSKSKSSLTPPETPINFNDKEPINENDIIQIRKLLSIIDNTQIETKIETKT